METESSNNGQKASPTELRIYNDGKSKLVYAPVWMLLLSEVTKPNFGTLDGETPPLSKTRAVELVNQLGILPERLTVHRVAHALRRYGDLPWFEGYLLLGEAPPKDLRVLNVTEVQAIDAALDYTAHMANAERVNVSGKRKDTQAYSKWFRRNVWRARTVDEWYERVLWMYSAISPHNVYVVRPNITQLRLAESESGRLTRARCGERSVVRWKASKTDSRALTLAIECSRKGYTPEWLDNQPDWIAAVGDHLWNELTGPKQGLAKASTRKKREAILRFAHTYHRPTTLAGLYPPMTAEDLAGEKRNCRDILNLTADEGDPLEDYITGKVPKRPNHMRQGMIRSGMFVPFPLMQCFNDVASKVWAQHGMDEIANTPGFKYLFLDKVLPHRRGPKPCPVRRLLDAKVAIYSGGTNGAQAKLRNWRRKSEPRDRNVTLNKAIAEAYQNGERDTAVLATRFDVGRQRVCRATKHLRTCHRKSTGPRDPAVVEKHRAIAADYRDGNHDVAELARRHGTSKDVVWKATRTIRALTPSAVKSELKEECVTRPTEVAKPTHQSNSRAKPKKNRIVVGDNKVTTSIGGRPSAVERKALIAKIVQTHNANTQLTNEAIAVGLGTTAKLVRDTLSNYRKRQRNQARKPARKPVAE